MIKNYAHLLKLESLESLLLKRDMVQLVLRPIQIVELPSLLVRMQLCSYEPLIETVLASLLLFFAVISLCLAMTEHLLAHIGVA